MDSFHLEVGTAFGRVTGLNACISKQLDPFIPMSYYCTEFSFKIEDSLTQKSLSFLRELRKVRKLSRKTVRIKSLTLPVHSVSATKTWSDLMSFYLGQLDELSFHWHKQFEMRLRSEGMINIMAWNNKVCS